MCRKSSLKGEGCAMLPLYLEKNSGRFSRSLCIWAMSASIVSYFLQGEDIYELNAHFFVVDILRKIEDVHFNT